MFRLSNQPANPFSTKRRRSRCGNGNPSQATSGARLSRLLLSRSYRNGNSNNQAPRQLQNSKLFQRRGFFRIEAWDLELSSSVSKMPDAREDHRHAALVGGGNHFLVSH